MNTPASHTEPLPHSIRTVAVVGLGLLGGSVAAALRRLEQRPAIRLVGCARRESTRRFGLENGGFDTVTADACEAAEAADLVVIATPVDRIAEYALEIAAACPNVLITDVGSTKERIVRSVATVPAAAARFVAAHPIAGSEKTGLQYARADLFDNKPIVITPSGHESAEAVAAVERFWEATGGRVLRLTPRRHDDLLAITSHTPHLIAALVAKQLPDEAAAMVGTGWLDTTRIAAGDENLWTAIVDENRDAILASLRNSADDLNHLIEIVRTSDNESLREYLRLAKERRLRAQT